MISPFIFILFFVSVLVCFFWRTLLKFFLYLFVPEKREITGTIVEKKKEKSSFSWPLRDYNYLPCPKLMTVIDYYLVIKVNQSDDLFTVLVNKNLFKSVFENQEISIECKKFSWENETDYEEVKI